MTRGREARDMRHLTAGDQCEAGRRRQTKQILEPDPAGFLDDRGRGTAGVQSGILIPSRGQPIRRERGGQRAADHPTKESSARTSQQAARAVGHHFIDHAGWLDAVICERTQQSCAQLVPRRGRRHRRDIQSVKICAGMHECPLEGVMLGDQSRVLHGLS